MEELDLQSPSPLGLPCTHKSIRIAFNDFVPHIPELTDHLAPPGRGYAHRFSFTPLTERKAQPIYACRLQTLAIGAVKVLHRHHRFGAIIGQELAVDQ